MVDVEKLVQSRENVTAQNSSPSPEAFCKKTCSAARRKKNHQGYAVELAMSMAGCSATLPVRPRTQEIGCRWWDERPLDLGCLHRFRKCPGGSKKYNLGHHRNKAQLFPNISSEISLQSSFSDCLNYTNIISLS